MRLIPTELDRLQVFNVAELARAALNRGLQLSLPEAIALITDEVHWSARAGATYEEARAAGIGALRAEQVLPGVPALLDEVRVEPLFAEGTRMIAIRWPLGRPDGGPGEVLVGQETLLAPDLAQREVVVVNGSPRVVRVSSHYPFHLVNRKLDFDRSQADGWRLNLPAGHFMRWGPGERRTVRLVPLHAPGVAEPAQVSHG